MYTILPHVYLLLLIAFSYYSHCCAVEPFSRRPDLTSHLLLFSAVFAQHRKYKKLSGGL